MRSADRDRSLGISGIGDGHQTWGSLRSSGGCIEAHIAAIPAGSDDDDTRLDEAVHSVAEGRVAACVVHDVVIDADRGQNAVNDELSGSRIESHDDLKRAQHIELVAVPPLIQDLQTQQLAFRSHTGHRRLEQVPRHRRAFPIDRSGDDRGDMCSKPLPVDERLVRQGLVVEPRENGDHGLFVRKVFVDRQQFVPLSDERQVVVMKRRWKLEVRVAREVGMPGIDSRTDHGEHDSVASRAEPPRHAARIDRRYGP